MLCVVLLAPFAAVALLPRRTQRSWYAPLIDTVWANRQPLTAFGLVALIALLFSIMPEAYWGEGGKWIAIVPYGILVTGTGLAVGVSPVVTARLAPIILISLVMLACSVWYDQLHP
ncbi:MAG: hypothetical protein ACK56I_23920, partial [bacterium]